MRQAVLLTSMDAFAAAAPTSQGIDFASVDAAPSPATTGPPASDNTQDVLYNTASVNAQGSAPATGVASFKLPTRRALSFGVGHGSLNLFKAQHRQSSIQHQPPPHGILVRLALRAK